MRIITNRFSCTNPHALLYDKDDMLHDKAKLLTSAYSNDVSSDFPNQLFSFRSIMKAELEKLSTIRQIAELLIVKHSSIMTSVPDIVTVFKIFLTIPVTVASAERSFSKLKLIKNYLRSTMSQERVSALSILGIENERARSLNLKDIVKQFAERKAGRRRLFY